DEVRGALASRSDGGVRPSCRIRSIALHPREVRERVRRVRILRSRAEDRLRFLLGVWSAHAGLHFGVLADERLRAGVLVVGEEIAGELRERVVERLLNRRLRTGAA